MSWLKSFLKGALAANANPPVSSDPYDDYDALTLARVDLATQGADVGTTALWTDGGAGSRAYCVSAFTVVTAADGASSTLPPVIVSWTDGDTPSGVTKTYSFGSAAAGSDNAVGVSVGGGSLLINVKAGTAITFITTGYVSATGGKMKFSAHVFIERQ